MSFGVVSVTAETDCSLMVSLLVTAVNGKTTFDRSLIAPPPSEILNTPLCTALY